jgi:hypothetical protein
MTPQFKEIWDSLTEEQKAHVHEYVGWLKSRDAETNPPPPPHPPDPPPH